MTNKMGIGVGVMILNKNGEILLGKRHSDPSKADSELKGEGTWTMPGGKVDFGDTLLGAGHREVFEETGIILDKNKMKLVSLTDDIIETAHFVTAGFRCLDCDQEPKVLEPDEIVEWSWFEINNLPENLFFPSKKLLDNVIRGKIY